jgi:hypothetical protein
MFDQYSFISYLKELIRKFHKLILFLDKHCRSQTVKAYIQRNRDAMIVEYLPKGSPDLGAVEAGVIMVPEPRLTTPRAITSHSRMISFRQFHIGIVHLLYYSFVV